LLPNTGVFAIRKIALISESALQIQLVKLLHLHARQDIAWWSVPNEGWRSARMGKRLKDMGMRPGASDLMFLIERMFHGVELKTEIGTQTETQKSFEAYITRAGGVYHIAYGLAEAIDVLEDIGVFRPGIRFTRRGSGVVA